MHLFYYNLFCAVISLKDIIVKVSMMMCDIYNCDCNLWLCSLLHVLYMLNLWCVSMIKFFYDSIPRRLCDSLSRLHLDIGLSWLFVKKSLHRPDWISEPLWRRKILNSMSKLCESSANWSSTILIYWLGLPVGNERNKIEGNKQTIFKLIRSPYL